MFYYKNSIFILSFILSVSLIPCKLRDPNLFDALYINIIPYLELKMTKLGHHDIPEVLYAPDTFKIFPRAYY